MQNITSKFLSEMLVIPHTKIRRWAKEFLQPDPKATLRSGYARELTVQQAFTVYLGGHLVSKLNFLVSDAKTILSDLHPWIESKGLYPLESDCEPEGSRRGIEAWEVTISKVGADEFFYKPIHRIKKRSCRKDGATLIHETYFEEDLFHTRKPIMKFGHHDPFARTLDISYSLRHFVRSVLMYQHEMEHMIQE